jgi:hypothetical protein
MPANQTLYCIDHRRSFHHLGHKAMYHIRVIRNDCARANLLSYGCLYIDLSKHWLFE